MIDSADMRVLLLADSWWHFPQVLIRVRAWQGGCCAAPQGQILRSNFVLCQARSSCRIVVELLSNRYRIVVELTSMLITGVNVGKHTQGGVGG